ncbi:MAG: tetraacyldisaccharide 4'-kinase [Bacteroidota bacterium]
MWWKWILFLFAWLYGIIILIRNFCYDNRIFSITNVGVPVISVGNISTGGTGKTPIVEYVVNFLQKSGKKIAVLSRGYQRSTSGTYLVSDGSKIFGDVSKCGDEPFQIAQKYPECVVVVDEKRVRGGLFIKNNFDVDAIILDDGFQHRKIDRIMDVVILDTQRQNQRLIPMGKNREQMRGLKRSSFVIFSRYENNVQSQNYIIITKKNSSAPTAITEFVPSKIENILNGTEKNIVELKDKNIFTFCGIGNPESFRTMLQKCGATICYFLAFVDHYNYTESDIDNLMQKFILSKAEYCITTEKDAMKIRNIIKGDIPVWILKIETKFLEGEEAFQSLLLNLLEGQKN